MLKKILGALISSFIFVGLIIIYYWRDVEYQPQSADLINYLLILPCVVTVILLLPWLIFKVYTHYKNKNENILPSEQEIIAESLSTVKESKWIELNLFANTAYNPIGENEAILEGIRAFTSPQLDPHLLNHHGLPILSYRINELDQQVENQEQEEELVSLSVRQQRIMAMIHHQIDQHVGLLDSISNHLKRSSLFYESQNLHEYRMHPAWTDPSFSVEDESEAVEIEPVYRLDQFNIHILLSEDLVHIWNDQISNESIQKTLFELGMIPQKFHIEYHYLSSESAESNLIEVLSRIQNQAHEITFMIVADSEIDQEFVDEKYWINHSYIPAEFIGSSCLASPAMQLEQQHPLKKLKLVTDQNSLDQIFKELDIHDLPQYQAEEPFVLVVEDVTEIKVIKNLEQFFAQSPIEQHHYLYCKPIAGHTQSIAKIFGLMLGAHLSDQNLAFVYSQNLKAFIQTVPEITPDQDSVAIAD